MRKCGGLVAEMVRVARDYGLLREEEMRMKKGPLDPPRTVP
jgi:hypothetical protein